MLNTLICQVTEEELIGKLCQNLLTSHTLICSLCILMTHYQMSKKHMKILLIIQNLLQHVCYLMSLMVILILTVYHIIMTQQI